MCTLLVSQPPRATAILKKESTSYGLNIWQVKGVAQDYTQLTTITHHRVQLGSFSLSQGTTSNIVNS